VIGSPECWTMVRSMPTPSEGITLLSPRVMVRGSKSWSQSHQHIMCDMAPESRYQMSWSPGLPLLWWEAMSRNFLGLLLTSLGQIGAFPILQLRPAAVDGVAWVVTVHAVELGVLLPLITALHCSHLSVFPTCPLDAPVGCVLLDVLQAASSTCKD